MMNHSTEPWRCGAGPVYEGDGAGGVGIEDAEGRLLAMVMSPEDRGEPTEPTDRDWANAARIIACVNACRGYSTEFLEEVAQGFMPLDFNDADKPTGDMFAQARAWRHVWRKLQAMGINEFIPLSGGGMNRALEFLDTLTRKGA